MPIFPSASTFGDAEEIICDFMDDILKDVDPRPQVGTWIADNANDYIDHDGGSAVIVRRQGGATDYRDRASVDDAQIQLSVISKTRAESWEIISYIRQKCYELSHGGVVGDWRITYIREADGPQNGLYEDNSMRLVRFYFMFGIRRKSR